MRRVLALAAVAAAAADPISVVIHNEMDEDAHVFWIHPETGAATRVGEATSHGGTLQQQTFPGHKFRFRGEDGAGNEFTIRPDRSAYSLTRSGKVRVECVVTGGKYGADGRGQLGLTVYPDWSPRGAARFLSLVRRRIFDGVAINRVVPNFLAQFGISADYDDRTKWRTRTIEDDTKQTIPFKPGYVAFAGSGPNSRTTEMFFVMPGAPPHQLEAFGTNPWETPFAVADDTAVRDVLPMLLNPYGDMPPWGKGPDPQRVYKRDGYDYLARQFPEIAYFESCRVIEAPMPQVAREL